VQTALDVKRKQISKFDKLEKLLVRRRRGFLPFSPQSEEMKLSSLLLGGPDLNITVSGRQDQLSDLSWSDIPVVVEEDICKGEWFVRETIQKEVKTIEKLSPPSTLHLSSSMSWPDFSIDGFEIGQTRETTYQLTSSQNEQNLIASTSSNLRTLHRKTVSFNKFLEIRQHAVTIGDHPSCKDSLPISLDWEHAEPILIDVDGYEAQRNGFRRRGNEMRLSYVERKNMLRSVSGLTVAERKGQYCL